MGGREQAVGKAGTPAGLRRVPAALLFLVPLLVLGAVVALFLNQEAALVGPSPVPPDALQKLQFERVTFEPGLIRVAVTGKTAAPPLFLCDAGPRGGPRTP